MILMIIRIIAVILVSVGFTLALVRLITISYASPRTFQAGTAPTTRVAIVFGAGLRWDGSPTAVLRDRVATAADLYFSGKVEKLLMSGDNRSVYYNEPESMKEFALALGIPETAIALDYAGQRTYDTCYRAKHIFGVTEATLVTQSFHLPRAIYTCNMLGLSAVGVSADIREYLKRSRIFWNIREIPATVVAFWEIHITKPKPILGSPEPLFPMEAQ